MVLGKNKVFFAPSRASGTTNTASGTTHTVLGTTNTVSGTTGFRAKKRDCPSPSAVSKEKKIKTPISSTNIFMHKIHVHKLLLLNFFFLRFM